MLISFLFGLLACVFAVLASPEAQAFGGEGLSGEGGQGLVLSGLKVEVISQGKKATYQLYDIAAADDETHCLGVGLSGVDDIAGKFDRAVIRKVNSQALQDENAMQILVIANGHTIVFELHDRQASKDLYAQLPLRIDVKNYGSNEKIFYPPRKLDTTDTPLVKSAYPGTFAYYSPWG